MRWIFYVACLALLCAACGSTERAQTRTPSCRAAITWHETFYYAKPFAALPARGASLGPAGVPSCRDVLGGEHAARPRGAVGDETETVAGRAERGDGTRGPRDRLAGDVEDAVDVEENAAHRGAV